MNFNCVVLDVVTVEIGDGTQIGPAVQLYAADHPRDAKVRRDGLEFGKPVRIGRHVWIGATYTGTRPSNPGFALQFTFE